MDTVEFLRRILPAAGFYIIARLVGKGWRHQVCDSIEEAAAYALQFDSQGVPTYHACAAYREQGVEREKDGRKYKVVRVQENVRAVKSFWLDLDVDPAKEGKYPSQEAAVDGLIAFCGTTGLPLPMVVSSGYGVHCYWTLETEVGPDEWKQAAEALKALCHGQGLRADPACTSDSARVLRSVGTWNRKVSEHPRPVELLLEADPVDFSSFDARIRAASKQAGIKLPEPRPQTTETERANEAFEIQRDFPPCSAVKVADRCAQLRAMRDTRGRISEPHWYACIQLMVNSTEGEGLIHEWSSGYSGYSQAETDRKIAQVREMGPTLCATFASRNPGGCDGCPHSGKITSPAQLGAVVSSAPAPKAIQVVDGTPIEITLPPPPQPFTRLDPIGLAVEEEGILHKFYAYDCYPTELAWDEFSGCETVKLRHFLPQEGWQECTLQSSLIAKPTEFEIKLRDNSIRPLIRKYMTSYIDNYMSELRDKHKLRKLFKSMGWKDNNTSFVLGEYLYQPDGKVIHAGHSDGAKGFLKNFRATGSLAEWRELTTVFDDPLLSAHAFLLLIGFVPPLLRITSRQGFTVCGLGNGGEGKTLMGQFMASIYGHPTGTLVPKDSTLNATHERMGAYESIPIYMDEVTTIEPKALRDLIYRVPTGIARDRLRADASAREAATWNTILVTSSNQSLNSKLQLERTSPEAEAMRLFEVEVPRVPVFAELAKVFYAALPEQHGTAGPRYIANLVAHRDHVVEGARGAIEQVTKELNMQPQERFWTQAIALSVYAGQLAHEWGVIGFDPQVIRPWLRRELHRMRGVVGDAALSAMEVLGEYLNEYIGERLVVKKINGAFDVIGKLPSKSLTQRLEVEENLLWVSRNHIKEHLEKKCGLSYHKIRRELEAKGVLVNSDGRKVLGAGTPLTGVEQTACWKIATNHPEVEARIGTPE